MLLKSAFETANYCCAGMLLASHMQAPHPQSITITLTIQCQLNNVRRVYPGFNLPGNVQHAVSWPTAAVRTVHPCYAFRNICADGNNIPVQDCQADIIAFEAFDGSRILRSCFQKLLRFE
jgi:hypothetical protein